MKQVSLHVSATLYNIQDEQQKPNRIENSVLVVSVRTVHVYVYICVSLRHSLKIPLISGVRAHTRLD